MQDIEFIPIPRQTVTETVTIDRLILNKTLLVVACLISLLVGIFLGVIGYVIF